MLLRSFRILPSPDAGDGGSNPPADDKGRTADPDAFQKLLDKNKGDSNALAFLLWNENKDYRQKNAELKSTLPPAGAVVLTGDDAKAWDGYRGLGKPEDLRKVVKEHSDLSGKVSAFEREKAVGEFGRKAGVPPDKLPLLLKLAGSATFEEKAEKVDGKDVARVLVKDGDSEPVPFDSYFADALPALRPDAKAEDRPRGTPPRNAPLPVPRAGDGLGDTPEGQLRRSGRYAKLS